MERHQPKYLSERSWMEIPWKDSSKRPIDQIADCLAFFPGIFQETDQFPKLGPTELLQSIIRLVTQCWEGAI